MLRRDDKNVRTRLAEFLRSEESLNSGCSASERDPELVEGLLRRMKGLFGPGKYFRVSVDGWDNVPEEASIFVSNHSGGTVIPDVWGFGYAWHERFGMERPLHPLAHDMVFAIPQMGRLLGRLGVLRARTGRAYKTLTHWRRDVMVMPGGDRDAWRPFRERYKVKFAGRKGYARLALRAGTPVIPMANAGAHQTLIVLTDGVPFAKFLRLDQAFRASIFPVSLSFPWGLTIGPWPHVPMPTHLRYKLGKAIHPPPEYKGHYDIPNKVVAEFDAQVQTAVQGLLDKLRADRRAERAERADELREKLGQNLEQNPPRLRDADADAPERLANPLADSTSTPPPQK